MMIRRFMLAITSMMMVTIAPVIAQAEDTAVYELRTYNTHPGKLDALHARFRDHTIAIFDRMGMESVGYWIPEGTPNTLIYILRHDSRDSARKSWKDFLADPAWVAAYQASTVNGPLLSRAPESVFMTATPYSALQ